MNAPCGWFDATPVGRIVNRFSQDISTVVSYDVPLKLFIVVLNLICDRMIDAPQDSSIIGSMYHFVDRLLATTQIVAIICISL